MVHHLCSTGLTKPQMDKTRSLRNSRHSRSLQQYWSRVDARRCENPKSGKRDTVTPDHSKVACNRFPNCTTGVVEKYGGNDMIQLERCNKALMLLVKSHLFLYAVESSDEESIYPSDLIFAKGGEIIFVVGSSCESGNGKDHEQHHGRDWYRDRYDATRDDFGWFPGRNEDITKYCNVNSPVTYLASEDGHDDWIPSTFGRLINKKSDFCWTVLPSTFIVLFRRLVLPVGRRCTRFFSESRTRRHRYKNNLMIDPKKKSLMGPRR